MASRHLSFSQLTTLMGCPEQHRLRYLVGLTSMFGYQVTVGQAVHAMAERCLLERMQGHDLMPIADAVELACTSFATMASTATNIDWSDRRLGRPIRMDEAVLQVDGFARQMYREALATMPADEATTGVELAFDIPIPGAPEWTFRGAIDHVRRRPDGSLWVDDWKTASSRWSQTRADQSLQVVAYLWALRELGGQLPAGMTFHVVTKDARGNVGYQAYPTLRDVGEVDAFADRLRYAIKVIGLHDADAPSDRRVEYEYHRYCTFRDRCTPWELSKDDGERFGIA